MITIQFNSASDYQHDKLWKHWHDNLAQKEKRLAPVSFFQVWARPRQDSVWFRGVVFPFSLQLKAGNIGLL